MSNLEEIFGRWAKGPAQTEQEKCERAVKAIRDAIAADQKLSGKTITIFAQGSYRNRTNIRLESDVDVCVCCKDSFFGEYPVGTKREDFGVIPATYLYPEFKNDVKTALVNFFGKSSVTPGNKAFDIKSNTYRVEADAVPTFEHRRYSIDGTWLSGVELRPDNGSGIINWPQQAYDNGVSKHTATSRRFKKIVRILKNLRNDMQKNNIAEAKDIASFLIECLVWNVPDNHFGCDTLTKDMRSILAFLINSTNEDAKCDKWVEVSRLKWLLHNSQPWTRERANQFLWACWRYIGFQ